MSNSLESRSLNDVSVLVASSSPISRVCNSVQPWSSTDFPARLTRDRLLSTLLFRVELELFADSRSFADEFRRLFSFRGTVAYVGRALTQMMPYNLMSTTASGPYGLTACVMP